MTDPNASPASAIGAAILLFITLTAAAAGQTTAVPSTQTMTCPPPLVLERVGTVMSCVLQREPPLVGEVHREATPLGPGYGAYLGQGPGYGAYLGQGWCERYPQAPWCRDE